MQVPRLEKIVINMGVGRATQQPSLLESAVADLTLISGQKPIVTKAKKSIAGFKLREGQRHRYQGHPARRPHVGVPRPPRRRGDPPHPRLPWVCRPTPGTAGATTPSGSPTRPSFPEIDYDKVDTLAAWTSPS
jgi:hypothetical protein